MCGNTNTEQYVTRRPLERSSAEKPQSCERATVSAVEVQVLGALTGELCSRLLADPSWTVRRLSAEIAEAGKSPAVVQRLIFGSRLLLDDDVVGDLLCSGGSDESASVLTVSMVQMTLRAMPVVSKRNSENLEVDSAGGVSRITWRVAAKKFQTRDRDVVSQRFELDMGPGFRRVAFKLMVITKHDKSFQTSDGRAFVCLKCEPRLPMDVGHVSSRVWVGDGENLQGPRGPFQHNFSTNALCGLPKQESEFDFSAAAAGASSYAIGFEVIHTHWSADCASSL